MPASGPSQRAGIFKRLNPAAVPPSHRQILFLKGQKDHLVFESLAPECRAALVEFLDKCWTDFETAYRASLRNSEYAGLVTSLTYPCNQEWYPRWIVHWKIGPHLDTYPPYELDDYVLMVEKLRQIEP